MAKVCIVTGCSAGIGLALCQHLSEKGYKVYGISRSSSSENSFHQLKGDVASKEIRAAVQEVIRKEDRVDLLVNNAGISAIASVEDFAKDDFDRLINTNVWGTVNLIQTVLPKMREQNRGQIINISSIAANHGLIYRGYYSASKASVNKITEALRLELLKANIQVCSLNLGSIQTDISQRRIHSDVNNFYKDDLQTVFNKLEGSLQKGKTTKEVCLYIDRLLEKKRWKANPHFGDWLELLSKQLKKIANPFWFERSLARYSGIKH